VPADDSVTVNPETFLAIQMAQLDDQAAGASVKVAEAELELAKIRKQRSQAILNYNIEQVKKVASAATTAPQINSPAIVQSAETPAQPASPEVASRAERRRRRRQSSQ